MRFFKENISFNRKIDWKGILFLPSQICTKVHKISDLSKSVELIILHFFLTKWRPRNGNQKFEYLFYHYFLRFFIDRANYSIISVKMYLNSLIFQKIIIKRVKYEK